MAVSTRVARSSVRFAPQICAVRTRQYSASAVPLDEEFPGVSLKASNPVGAAKVSKHANGLTVVAQETNSPVASVSLLIGAGTRDENSTNTGVSAVARRLAFKSTPLHSQLAIAREIERLGGDLTATSSREATLLTVQASRDNLPRIVGLLAEELGGRYEPLAWDVKQTKAELQFEIGAAAADPSFQVIEALHSAAFRGPLSQSVLPASYRVDEVDTETVAAFIKAHYNASNAAIAATGVSPDELVSLAGEAFGVVEKGARPTRQAAKYKGGQEVRLDAATGLNYVAMGFEGVALSSPQRLAAGVLLQALGTGPVARWGSSPSRLFAGVAKTMKTPVQLSAFSSSYSDAGLFGVVAVASAQDIGCLMGVAKDVLASVASSGLTDAEVARAKAQLKTAVLSAGEGEGRLEDMASQAYLTGSYVSPAEAAKQIDALSAADVNKVAKAILSSKASLATVGNTGNSPFLDQVAF